MKNPHAVALGKLGGSVSSAKKTEANKKNIAVRWAKNKVKKGKNKVDIQSA